MKTTVAKMVACLVLAGASVTMAENTMQSAVANMDVDKLEGRDLLDANGTQLGDVDEIVVDKANRRMAVIGMEDSDKEVVVSLDKLSLSADGEKLTTSLTRTEMLALPDYDPTDMKSAEE